MPIRVAVPAEVLEGERRLALVPDVAKKLQQLGLDVALEADAGKTIGLDNDQFPEVDIVADKKALLSGADVVLKVQPPTAEEIAELKEGSILISFLAPHADDDRVKALRDGKITSFSMELVPRITRAQAIDALSSQASAAGYKAVLMGASLTGKFFPMLTTAAGTIRPSKVLIIGAGVAGLQAIATAKRLGAIVEAYDVRSATKEQCESLGAKFIDMDVKAEGEGGYARELTDEEKAQQQEKLAEHVAKADVVITTAAIPGRPAPKIITKDMVARMSGGAVVVDLAAETGGNCELTVAGETITTDNGVMVHGPQNVPSTLNVHTSEMYSKNLLNLITLFVNEGELNLDWEDEVLADSCLTHAGEIKHQATKERVEGA